jgi:hypothetical protein
LFKKRLFGWPEEAYRLCAINRAPWPPHLLPHEAANLGASIELKEQTMRISSLLRTATLALSMTAAMGAMTAAFAADAQAAQQQAVNTSPYDSPNFVVPSNNIN